MTPFCQSKSIRVTGVKREIFPASSFWTCNCFFCEKKRDSKVVETTTSILFHGSRFTKKVGGGVELSLIFGYDSRSLL